MIAWTALESLVQPAFGLFSVTLLYQSLGGERYGLLAISLAVINLGLLMQIGLGAALTKIVAQDDALATSPLAVAAVRGTLRLLAATGVLVVIVAALADHWLARAIFPATSSTAASELEACVLLIAVCIFLQLLDAAISGILRGKLRFMPLAATEVAVKATLAAALVSVCMARQASLDQVLLCFAAAYAASLLLKFLAACAISQVRNLFTAPGGDWYAGLRGALDFGKWFSLQGLAAVAFNTLDKLLIGKMLGAGAAGLYSALAQIASLIHYIPAQTQGYMLAVSSRLANAGTSAADLRRYLVRECGLNGALTLAVAAAVLMLPELLAMAGTSLPPLPAVTATFVALSVSYVLISFNTPFFYFLLGTGKARTVAATNLAAGMATLLLQVLAARSGDLEWVCYARCAFVLAVVLNLMSVLSARRLPVGGLT